MDRNSGENQLSTGQAGTVSQLLLLSCVAGAASGRVQGGRERVSVEARSDNLAAVIAATTEDARARRERAAGGDVVRAVAGAKASRVGVRAGDGACNGGF